MQFTLCNSLYALHSMHFTLCTSLYALHSMRFTLCTSLCALASMHFTLCTLLYALHSMHFALCTSLYALRSMHFTLCTSLYALHSMHFTLCTSLYALHSMHFTLCTSVYVVVSGGSARKNPSRCFREFVKSSTEMQHRDGHPAKAFELPAASRAKCHKLCLIKCTRDLCNTLPPAVTHFPTPSHTPTTTTLSQRSSELTRECLLRFASAPALVTKAARVSCHVRRVISSHA